VNCIVALTNSKCPGVETGDLYATYEIPGLHGYGTLLHIGTAFLRKGANLQNKFLIRSGIREFPVMQFLSRCICDSGMNWIPARGLVETNRKNDVFTFFGLMPSLI
jgi:hypothetical protein